MIRVFPLLLAVLLLSGTAFAEDRLPPQARQVLHKAQMSVDDSRLADAVSILHDYMAQTKEVIPYQAYLMLGGLHHKSGDKKKAFSTFRDGMKAYPDNGMLVRNSAILCYELGRYADAGRFFEKAYALQVPPKPALLFQAGSAYYSGEDYTTSAQVMARLLSVEKKPKKEWVRLAVHAHLEARQFKRAETILRKYLAENPGEDPYWELLAKLHLDRAEYEKAAGAMEICYRLRSPSSRELERLASLYAYSNAPLMASATLERAYPGTTDVERAVKIALLYASAGRPDEAVKALSRCGSTRSLEKKGRILYQARRFNEAEEVLHNVVSQTAKAGESAYFLAMCAWEKRDWKTARTLFKSLAGNKKFSRRIQAPLAVIDDIEGARREALN